MAPLAAFTSCWRVEVNSKVRVAQRTFRAGTERVLLSCMLSEKSPAPFAVAMNASDGKVTRPQADLRLSRTRKKSGQAFVEYVLISAILIGVIMGVLQPILKERFDAMGDTLRSNAVVVISQQRLGIPIEWFFSDAGSTGLIPGSGQSGGGSGEDGSQPDSADSGAARGPGAGGRAGGFLGSTLSGSGGSTNVRGANGLGSGDDAETEEQGLNRDLRSRRRGSFAADEGVGGGVSNPDGTDGTNDDENAEKPKDDESADKKTILRRDQDRESRARSGCGNFNIFTLLKILAILAILILAGAVALSGRGNKGSK